MRNHEILFSLIVTTFNSMYFVKDILTLVKENNNYLVEIIIVDDNSNDGTFEELSKFNYHNYNVLGKTENKGVSHSRNLGIKNAKGEKIYC